MAYVNGNIAPTPCRSSSRSSTGRVMDMARKIEQLREQKAARTHCAEGRPIRRLGRWLREIGYWFGITKRPAPPPSDAIMRFKIAALNLDKVAHEIIEQLDELE